VSSQKTLARRWLALAVALVAVGLAACGGGSGSGGASGAAAKLVDIQGTVTVNGQATSAAKELAVNDKIQVAQGGVARVLYPDGTKVLLVGRAAEGTELTIGTTTQEQGIPVMLVKLVKGVLSFVVPPASKGKVRYEIEAQSSLTVIRGTSGAIKTDASQDVVALKTGTVEVLAKNGGKSGTVNAGQQITVQASGDVSTPKPYDFSDDSERELYNEGPLLMKTLTH